MRKSVTGSEEIPGEVMLTIKKHNKLKKLLEIVHDNVSAKDIRRIKRNMSIQSVEKMLSIL